jgi:hypothetical protein
MTVTIERETTEYLYTGITGSPPSSGAEVAFLTAGSRPATGGGDWVAATVVPDSGHALWADATASGVTGDYYVAILVGTYGGNTVDPGMGSWQQWIRLTDVTERPVRIAPEAIVIN